MGEKIFFEIPDNSLVRSVLIESIPYDWGWMSGQLIPSERFSRQGLAVKNTGYLFERFRTPPQIIGWAEAHGGRSAPKVSEITDLIVGQKWPAFVEFDTIGYEFRAIRPFSEILALAAGFVRLGYTGGLSFYKDCHDNNKFDNPAKCWMRFRSWHGNPFAHEKSGEHPPTIELEWNERYGGKAEDLAPILSVCRSFNLTQYSPLLPEEAVA